MQSLARFVLCGLAFSLAYAGQGNEQPKPVIFPAITSYSLDKAKVNLPEGLAAQIDLLLISFEPEQQKQIDTWMPAAQALQHTHFNFRWYRLPVSARQNFVFRWWTNSSMRSDETDPETWPWIIPLYVDRDEFRNALQIPNEREVVALLIDRQGHVLWRASGALTPASRGSLISAVASAMQH
jgi:hypothetical protein